MFICSTILYFNDEPVGYDLYKAGEGFELLPTPLTASGLTPKPISILPLAESWQVTGVDEDIRQQVLKLVEMQEAIDLRTTMSAAS